MPLMAQETICKHCGIKIHVANVYTFDGKPKVVWLDDGVIYPQYCVNYKGPAVKRHEPKENENATDGTTAS